MSALEGVSLEVDADTYQMLKELSMTNVPGLKEPKGNGLPLSGRM